MDVSSIAGFFATLGVGSIITLFLREWWDSKKIISKRHFDTKLKAYSEYLTTIMISQTKEEKEASWLREAHKLNMRLCASKEILERVVDMLNALSPQGKQEDKEEAVEALIQAMRKDLWG